MSPTTLFYCSTAVSMNRGTGHGGVVYPGWCSPGWCIQGIPDHQTWPQSIKPGLNQSTGPQSISLGSWSLIPSPGSDSPSPGSDSPSPGSDAPSPESDLRVLVLASESWIWPQTSESGHPKSGSLNLSFRVSFLCCSLWIPDSWAPGGRLYPDSIQSMLFEVTMTYCIPVDQF